MTLTPDSKARRGARAVMAVCAGRDHGDLFGDLPGFPADAEERGYFKPEEDRLIRVRYAQYLAERLALTGVLAELETACGPDPGEWSRRRSLFLSALVAACLLVGGARELRRLVMQSRLLRKTLDERDPVHGVPPKTFARLYRASTSPVRLLRLHAALKWFDQHRADFEALEDDPDFAPLLERVDSQRHALDPSIEDIWRDRLRYRWFSFRRRHHSAWKKSLFHVFRWSGSLVADLQQPGVKAPGAPKRVTLELRESLLSLVRPGDIFITRHDDAMSNLFLPGFWPHAALFLGDRRQREEIGLELPDGAPEPDGAAFLESRKDGVRIRPAAETLEVDAFVVLRPPLGSDDLREALARALGHWGKLYDFLFDFRKSERLVCTEVVYRGFDGCGGVRYRLEEVSGRLCLPAEELIAQSLEQGFEVVASGGIGAGGLLRGQSAELALHSTRAGI